MIDINEIWQLLEGVFDPEVPVLTVVDLGIIRHIAVNGTAIIVTITPTYSGCPAMNTIEKDIKTHLSTAGYDNVHIKTVLSPSWTTDWLSEAGKEKLHAYGIAPPVESSSNVGVLFGRDPSVSCPQCGSSDTVMVSLFGSTACKALYKCHACLEPFDYFKCLR